MPEMLTKYPDTALKILKDAKIQCGSGAKQQILTWCPKEKFCAFPTGEMCIYGIRDMPSMMQIHTLDILFLPGTFLPLTALAVMIFTLGILTGIKLGGKNSTHGR
ncbi:hypothetical protein AQUSIP_20700 [Aquicella siphonis]|uniref:Uncharacterized protein n=1 Tax=Aquicella siphonis TaxID=254247 RepID=A0A5E4PJK1_9COXI|nr:hypothetical protein [Aquicella siphonis]VVC76745.1 hypothetical protein AQUSIP_20700 [Aquicella siphonis]